MIHARWISGGLPRERRQSKHALRRRRVFEGVCAFLLSHVQKHRVLRRAGSEAGFCSGREGQLSGVSAWGSLSVSPHANVPPPGLHRANEEGSRQRRWGPTSQ